MQAARGHSAASCTLHFLSPPQVMCCLFYSEWATGCDPVALTAWQVAECVRCHATEDSGTSAGGDVWRKGCRSSVN